MVDPVSAAIGIGGSLLSGILGGSSSEDEQKEKLRKKLKDFLES